MRALKYYRYCSDPSSVAEQFAEKPSETSSQVIVDNTLQHTATHCNTLQHTTKRREVSRILQSHKHSATLCNTLHIDARRREPLNLAETVPTQALSQSIFLNSLRLLRKWECVPKERTCSDVGPDISQKQFRCRPQLWSKVRTKMKKIVLNERKCFLHVAENISSLLCLAEFQGNSATHCCRVLHCSSNETQQNTVAVCCAVVSRKFRNTLLQGGAL